MKTFKVTWIETCLMQSIIKAEKEEDVFNKHMAEIDDNTELAEILNSDHTEIEEIQRDERIIKG